MHIYVTKLASSIHEKRFGIIHDRQLEFDIEKSSRPDVFYKKAVLKHTFQISHRRTSLSKFLF